jgi:hypothetical protein
MMKKIVMGWLLGLVTLESALAAPVSVTLGGYQYSGYYGGSSESSNGPGSYSDSYAQSSSWIQGLSFDTDDLTLIPGSQYSYSDGVNSYSWAEYQGQATFTGSFGTGSGLASFYVQDGHSGYYGDYASVSNNQISSSSYNSGLVSQGPYWYYVGETDSYYGAYYEYQQWGSTTYSANLWGSSGSSAISGTSVTDLATMVTAAVTLGAGSSYSGSGSYYEYWRIPYYYYSYDQYGNISYGDRYEGYYWQNSTNYGGNYATASYAVAQVPEAGLGALWSGL